MHYEWTDLSKGAMMSIPDWYAGSYSRNILDMMMLTWGSMSNLTGTNRHQQLRQLVSWPVSAVRAGRLFALAVDRLA
jgi:hypothetical protein